MGFVSSVPSVAAKANLQDGTGDAIDTRAVGFWIELEDEESEDHDEQDRETVRVDPGYQEIHARDDHRPQAEEGREVKGDPRKKTERARRIRALIANRINDDATLRAVAETVPERHRPSFLEAIKPHLKFTPAAL